MLIVVAFCIALNVTLQEVGEHDLVDLRFGRFQSLEAFGRFGVHGCNKRHKNELVKKKKVQEKLNHYFFSSTPVSFSE